MFMYDFKNFRKIMFTVDVEVPWQAGEKGRGSEAINDKPYIITYLTHQIIHTVDLAESVQIVQHGLYRIDFSLYQQERFWQGTPPMADAAYGSIRHGIWKKFEVPVALEKNRTLNVEITNVQDQIVHAAYEVQVQFHGFEDLRTEDQIRADSERERGR